MEAFNDTIESLKEQLKACNEANLKLIDQAAKDKKMNVILANEVTALRKQLVELTSEIKTLRFNVLPGDSLAKDEGLNEILSSTSEEEEEKMDAEEFQVATKRKRKPKRKNATQSSSSEDDVPAKKSTTKEIAKENSTQVKERKVGKPRTNSQTVDDVNFPPLPTPEPNSTVPVAPVTVKKISPRPIKTKAIPPIVVTNAGKFTSISSLFRANQIKYSSAVVVRNGIKVFPCTEEDYRKATRLLDSNKEPYYTFRFPEEKLNHVVLRGTPTHLTKEEISADLIRQGFSPKNIIRWKHQDGRPMPMVLVLLPKAEQDIYKVRVICTFEVRAEAQKSRSRSIQCYNCQDHGHAAPCCHVPPKCVKCGASHHTAQCTKARADPPKCANCGGDHPASFSGCPNHPAQLRTKKQSTFQGWGLQDNSRLASNNAQKQAPKAEPLLSNAQLAQISKLFAEQLKSFMTQAPTNARQ